MTLAAALYTIRHEATSPSALADGLRRLRDIGYRGVEAAGDDDLSIAVSYWESDEAIRAFKELAEHLVIQKRGRETYYKNYKMRVARVERDYGFNV